jgi:7-carboxy-7-deazaguanine synthase
MLGTNPIRKQFLGDGQQLWIQEVFYTLQGEGPLSGRPAIFVRTAGCNLKCYWCDTDFESSTWHPALDELLERIDDLRRPFVELVVLTGGEPFRQNIRPLVERLLERNLKVQIETNGILWVELPEDSRITIVCSPKTNKLNPKILSRITSYKYVIAAGETDPEDGLPSTSTQRLGLSTRIYRPRFPAEIFVMPRDDGDIERNRENQRACTQVALNYGYRLCLQMHKAVGLR